MCNARPDTRSGEGARGEGSGLRGGVEMDWGKGRGHSIHGES
jgi:hypothetical protein